MSDNDYDNEYEGGEDTMDYRSVFYKLVVPENRRKEWRNKLIARYGCYVWTTKEWNMIPLIMMRDDHLRSTLHHCIRSSIKTWFSDEKTSNMLYVYCTRVTAELKRRGLFTDADKRALDAFEAFEKKYPRPDREDESAGYWDCWWYPG